MLEEIRLSFIKYLDTYFFQRDLQSTLDMFSPNITGYGTGVDEIAYDFDGFKKLFERDISEAPNPVRYHINKLHITSPLRDIGIVSCELNIQTQVLGQELKINKLRLSVVFVLTTGRWLIEHMHISLPTQEIQEKESYPIIELEEQNLVLQRLVEEKTGKLNEAIKEISILATTDKLTRIFNRLKIDEHLDNELQRSQRYGNSLSIILFDIDNFKSINDNYGHLTGDQILVEIAEITSDKVRQTEFVGRWGGEEFLVICPETQLDQAVEIAERIRFTIEAYQFKGTGSISMTASFGVSSYRTDDTRDIIISRTDEALYIAKGNGKNQVVAR